MLSALEEKHSLNKFITVLPGMLPQFGNKRLKVHIALLCCKLSFPRILTQFHKNICMAVSGPKNQE